MKRVVMRTIPRIFYGVLVLFIINISRQFYMTLTRRTLEIPENCERVDITKFQVTILKKKKRNTPKQYGKIQQVAV